MDPAARWRWIQGGCGEMRWQTRKHLNSVQRCTCKHATWFIPENIWKHYILRFCVRRCYANIWKISLRYIFSNVLLQHGKTLQVISTNFQNSKPYIPTIFKQGMCWCTCKDATWIIQENSNSSFDVIQNIWRKSLYIIVSNVWLQNGKTAICDMISTNFPKNIAQYFNNI